MAFGEPTLFTAMLEDPALQLHGARPVPGRLAEWAGGRALQHWERIRDRRVVARERFFAGVQSELRLRQCRTFAILIMALHRISGNCELLAHVASFLLSTTFYVAVPRCIQWPNLAQGHRTRIAQVQAVATPCGRGSLAARVAAALRLEEEALTLLLAERPSHARAIWSMRVALFCYSAES